MTNINKRWHHHNLICIDPQYKMHLFDQAVWSGKIPIVTQHFDQERFSKLICDRNLSDLCSLCDGLSTTLSIQLNSSMLVWIES